jgi:hypothetical protein
VTAFFSVRGWFGSDIATPAEQPKSNNATVSASPGSKSSKGPNKVASSLHKQTISRPDIDSKRGRNDFAKGAIVSLNGVATRPVIDSPRRQQTTRATTTNRATLWAADRRNPDVASLGNRTSARGSVPSRGKSNQNAAKPVAGSEAGKEQNPRSNGAASSNPKPKGKVIQWP